MKWWFLQTHFWFLDGSMEDYSHNCYHVWSLDPDARMWPIGCHFTDQIIVSCACSIDPTSFDEL